MSSTPWRLEWSGQQLKLLDANGEEITEWTYAIPTWGAKYEAAKAECDTDAHEHIVRCVNSFDDLVAALDRVNRLMGEGAESDDASWVDIHKQVYSALAKARGES